MRAFVLGHRGMLGHVVSRYLKEQGIAVLTSDLRYTGEADDPLVATVVESSADWVINCLGRIKQKSADPGDLYLANAIFPHHLTSRLAEGQRLIHASSDCVFSGRDGNYSFDAQPDPDDTYGLSKLIGETISRCPRVTVLRVSIVGPEESGNKGLLGWFLSETAKVRGFVDHKWNGVTTLEWSKQALRLLRSGPAPSSGLLQLGCYAPLSKFEMLQLFAHFWNHEIEVIPVVSGQAIDRTLKPQFTCPPFSDQLKELASWYGCNPA